MARQYAAHSRYVATAEPVNKTVAVASKGAAGKGKEAAKIEDGKLLKRKLKEPDEWVDHASKTHQKPLHASPACQSLSQFLWRLLDAFYLSLANSRDLVATEKDVRLGELYTHKALMDRIDELLSMRDLMYTHSILHTDTP